MRGNGEEVRGKKLGKKCGTFLLILTFSITYS